VEFVNAEEQKYSAEMEVREKPGTPGILQILRASLALELKERLGPRRIEEREAAMIREAMGRLSAHPAVQIIGNPDPARRIAILSFNIRMGDSWLHPRFVTLLLNDLFGIQSRAGCSCAGPYGHRLLKIDGRKSLEFREEILHGHVGVKPGWARVNFHFLMSDAEFDFLCQAILFVAEKGRYFLPQYEFQLSTGAWKHRDFRLPRVGFGLEEALAGWTALAGPPSPASAGPPPGPETERELFAGYLREAERLARELEPVFSRAPLDTTERDLIPFVYCRQ
jgi:hypothetical protein